MAELSEMVIELGFNDVKEFHHLVAKVNLTSPIVRLLFERWKLEDGSKKGLLEILNLKGSK